MSAIKSAYETQAHQLQDFGGIDWSCLIFAPFHPVFRLFVLFSVIVKTVLGPIQSVYPIVYCSDAMDVHPVLIFIKYFYWYGCDTIYGADTFLHIVHRQVTDKAMKREYLPKSALLIVLDLLSLIPFFRMVAPSICPEARLWPNILAFNEFLIIYRGVQYFSLITTHYYPKMILGYTIILAICLNCLSCFWLLLTYEGLCDNCIGEIYDWRNYIQYKLNETNVNFTTYIYGATFISTFALNKAFDEVKPHTILEFEMTCLFIVCGRMYTMYIILPKAFAESLLRLRQICERYPDVRKTLDEAKRRSSSLKSYEYVKSFHILMWKKRSGITNMPEIISDIPRYLRLDIRQDLIWQFFYHSPTLRKTSICFKRWLCEHVKLEYRLPGDRFYIGAHSQANLYYIKLGVVQIISSEDGTTPILSLTGGTILGDVCFLIPLIKRKTLIRCLTFCEIIYAERKDLLRAISKYPKDRAFIMNLKSERLEHARDLYTCKQDIKGYDRVEDEGLAWITKRWHEISAAMHTWNKHSRKDRGYIKCVIPPEESKYHCAKYIGQLVLCTEDQLNTKSMFMSCKFPWILTPDSRFGIVWHRVVLATVFLVLLTYPPNLTRDEIPQWFKFVGYWTDFVYIIDICVSLLTCLREQEGDSVNFSAVMFARCKCFKFILDVLSAIWMEDLVIVIGLPNYYYTVQFNRLIKIYILFSGDYTKMDVTKNPDVNVNFEIFLIQFCTLYITSYVLYEIDNRVPDLTTSYFFGARYCGTDVLQECNPAQYSILGVLISWIFELLFCEYLPQKLIDIYLALWIGYFSYIIYVFCKMKLVACLYLKYRDIVYYQHFVYNLKDYYVHHKIHPDLLKRLEKYLICHWKYYKGKDVIYPNMMREEPYDIYWKVQGEVAEKIIGESKAFVGADPTLIRELAHAAHFMILPTNSNIIMFGALCKNVTWIVQGCIKGEFHDEAEQLLTEYYDSGQMLSVSSVFLGKASLTTYSSYTECEILYIRVQEFFNILKRYHAEWNIFETCVNEFSPEYQEIFHRYVIKHRGYQCMLRSRLYSHRMSTIMPPGSRRISDLIDDNYRSSPQEGVFWGEPDSICMRYWLIFRALTVCVSIISASLQGGIGASHRWPLIIIGAYCDCIAWIDIVLKLCLGYYDSRGILITDRRKCLIYYLTRGFTLDVIGAIPASQILAGALTQTILPAVGQFIDTICKFAHLYIVTEFFNYLGDISAVNISLIMIIKWQVVIILCLLCESHFLMMYCIDYTFDEKWNLISMQRLNTCWIPQFLRVGEKVLTLDDLHFLFIESFSLTQSGLMRTNLGRFHVDRENLAVGCSLLFFAVIWWFVACYTLTLLILNARGHTLFKHGVNQLKRFLLGERVEKELIQKAISYFRYSWLRTRGVNIHYLTYERIGVVFRQDLSFYIYRRTFMALDTAIGAGEPVVRQLASVCTQIYFLPGQEIIREMNISLMIFIVHRGKVVVTKDGERITTLSKGCIFGQLEGTKKHAIHVTVTADEHVDLLQISIRQFQDIITDEVRNKIARSAQANFNFMAVEKQCPENPYDTVEYILRGRKTIHLPWMSYPIEARTRSWYYRWLVLAWLGEPFVSASIVIMLGILPPDYIKRLYWVLGPFDLIHFGHIISEFYAINLDVEHDKCVKRIAMMRRFKQWQFYVDVMSLLIPLITIFSNDWRYQVARLLRLRLMYEFEVQFRRQFKSVAAEVLMKIMILCLLFHTFTCGWIYVACRHKDIPVFVPQLTKEINKTIDFDQWVLPQDRGGEGCYRLTKNVHMPDGSLQPGFVVAKHWKDDYVVALMYILVLYTHLNLDSTICLSTSEVYYKVIITFIIFLIDIWIVSITINAMYTKFRELYQYDYNLRKLITYLRHSGLASVLSHSTEKYTKQLWNRQRGNWLPELVYFAPDCLREDLFVSLYMYHLNAPPMYRNLPKYFKRQMAARLQRVVIFPGKCIIREGDIFSCTYFIHEGEVEKWYTNPKGESKFQSLLYTNGFFGTLPGLISTPFQFSYYTRTVVDLIYLKLEDWKDLLDSYPSIKRELLRMAYDLKRELMK